MTRTVPDRPSETPAPTPGIQPAAAPSAHPASLPPLPGARTHEHLHNYPPPERWDVHVEYDAKAHPR
ncbi:MAG: hypothetical protein ABR528_06895, partial [Pseudonocardiaceae bacterium]